jgi:hypothetical protein
MEERFAYGLNPQKLGAVSSHLCDPATAAVEFLLVKSECQAVTAWPVERGAEQYNLVVKPPEHKLALYGAGGNVPPLSRPTRPSALHFSGRPAVQQHLTFCRNMVK